MDLKTGARSRCMCPSTRWAISLHWWSRPPMDRSVRRSKVSPSRYRQRANRTWNWPMWIRATPAKRPSKPRPPTASSWRWSNWPKPSTASCSCPDAGLSNAPLLGWQDSGGFPATTNDCRQRSPDYIGWPSSAFYSATCQDQSLKLTTGSSQKLSVARSSTILNDGSNRPPI